MKMRDMIFGIASLFLMTACGSSKSDTAAAPPPPASDLKGRCDAVTVNSGAEFPSCSQVVDVNQDQLDIFANIICEDERIDGEFTADAECPTEDSVATCELDLSGRFGMEILFHFYPFYSEQSAALACEQIQAFDNTAE